MSRNYLLSIPQEILDLIIAIVHYNHPPGNILALGQTCRAIHRALGAAGFLERRQQWHREYRTVSDLMPLTIPSLVRGAIENPLHEAWHVRRMEIWDNRCDFKSWTMVSDLLCYDWADVSPRSLTDSHDAMPASTEDGPTRQIHREKTQGCNAVLEHIDFYLSFIKTLFEEHESDYCDESADLLAHGNDGIIKAMFMSMCPNLNTLTFMGPSKSAVWFTKFILSRHLATEPWPLCLQALRKVTIGGETDLRQEIFQTRSYYEVVPLFLLPMLKVLRLIGVGNWSFEIDEVDLDFSKGLVTPGTSSVEALELTHLDIEGNAWLLEQLVALPHSLKILKLSKLDLFQGADVDELPMLRSLEVLTIEKPLTTIDCESHGIGTDIPFVPCIKGYPAWAFVHQAGYADPRQISEPGDDVFDPNFDHLKLPTTGSYDNESQFPQMPVILSNLSDHIPPVEVLEITHFQRGCSEIVDCEKYCHSFVWLNSVLRCINRSIDKDSRYARLRVLCIIVDEFQEGFEWDDDAMTKLRAKGITIRLLDQNTINYPQGENEWDKCLEDRHETDPRRHFDGTSGEYYGLPYTVPERFQHVP